MNFFRRRIVKYVTRALLGSLALILITSVLLVCRLLISPMQLDTLSPAIERALSGLPGNHAVRMEGVELAWDRATHVLQLRATQVALVDHSGDRIVAAPAVNISISVNALMSRVIALSSIKLEGAKIHLLRSKDGTLQLGTKVDIGTAGVARPHKTEDFHDLTDVIAGAFASLESPPNQQHPLSYLEAIELQGDFTIEDQKLDMEFVFRDINFSFRGKENGVAGDLSLSVASPQAFSGVDLDVSLLARGADITVNIKASGVEPAKLAGLSDRLEALEGVDLSLDATVVGAVKLPDTVKSLDLTIVGGAGSISLDQFFAEPLSIKSLKLKAQLDPAARHVDLDYLDMSLGKDDSAGPSLNVSGSAHSVDGTTTLDMVTAIEHFQVEDLATYWPAGIVPGARDWLTENLKVGSIDKASVSAKLTFPAGKGSAPLVEKLQGKLAYSELSVFFFRPLPPATGVSGSGTFNRQGFDLAVEHGLVEGVAIDSGRVQIKGVDVGKVSLEVTTSLDGAVADALAILESPPFSLDKVIGIGAAAAGGQLSAKFNIALPLQSGLKPGDIDYQVDARLRRASVQNVVGNLNVENGALKIAVTPRHFAIVGSLELGGFPVALEWHGAQDEDGALQNAIKARAATIDAIHLNGLGYPVDKYLSGSFALELDADTGPGGVMDMAINADLGKSGLSIPALQWSKPAGEEGSVSAVVRMSEGRSVSAAARMSEGSQFSVKQLRIEAGTLSARGEASYDATDTKITIDLDSAALGRTALNDLTLSHSPAQGTRIKVAGGRLDLAPLLSRGSSPDDNHSDRSSSVADNKNSRIALDSLYIDVARLDRVFFSKDQYLENVSLGLSYEDSGWQSIRLHGRNPYRPKYPTLSHSRRSASRLTPGEFKFDFGPPDQGSYPLLVKVEDLGAMLVTTLDNHMMLGGHLTAKGDSSAALLTAPVSASVKLERFTVTEAPVVVKVLGLASLSEPLEALKSEGLAFDSFFGELSFSEQKVSTDLLRIHGGTLGAIIAGNMDIGEAKVDLKGSLIPLYRLKNVVEKIPLLGKVLVGDDGRGIFALDYSVKGSADDPEVAVRPGSMLTPRHLRHIFSYSEDAQKVD